MDKNAILKNPFSKICYERGLIRSVLDSASQAEKLGLPQNKIIVSVQGSDVQDLIEVYTNLSKRCNYPFT